MATLWMLTGSTENWLTGIKNGVWAFPENPTNAKLWNEINRGDIGIFHATKKSAYWYQDQLQPSILGYSIIGIKEEKNTLWFDDEEKDKKNKWPLVIHFEKIFITKKASVLDFSKSIKPDDNLIKVLSWSGYNYSDFRKVGKSLYPDIGKFMDQKSLQKLDPRYDSILKELKFNEVCF